MSYYYIDKPVISGNFSAICDGSQRTFSESAFTDIDLNYDWNCSGPLSEVDGDGTPQYTVERTILNGPGTVSLSVTTPSGATAASSKDIWVGAPATPTEIIPFWNNGMEFGNDSYYDFRAVPYSSTLYYNWDVDGGTITEGQGTYWITVKTQKITGDFNVNFSVGVRAGSLGCGESSRFVRTGWVIPGTGGATLAFTPNPATGETTLSIETTSEDSEFDENAEWELEVYSPAQLLKEKKNNLRGKSAKIQTSGWTEGIYMVRVKYKDEVLQGKLVVKR